METQKSKQLIIYKLANSHCALHHPITSSLSHFPHSTSCEKQGGRRYTYQTGARWKHFFPQTDCNGDQNWSLRDQKLTPLYATVVIIHHSRDQLLSQYDMHMEIEIKTLTCHFLNRYVSLAQSIRRPLDLRISNRRGNMDKFIFDETKQGNSIFQFSLNANEQNILQTKCK